MQTTILRWVAVAIILIGLIYLGIAWWVTMTFVPPIEPAVTPPDVPLYQEPLQLPPGVDDFKG